MAPNKKAILSTKAGHLGKMASKNKNLKKYTQLFTIVQSISLKHNSWRLSCWCAISQGSFQIKKIAITRIFNLLLQPLQGCFLPANDLRLNDLFCSGKLLQDRYIIASKEVIPCFLMI